MNLPLIATVLDILFPRHCLGCKKDRTLLCGECTKKVRRELHAPDNWTFAYFSYHDHIIKDSLWHLKYKGRYGYGKMLGKLLYDEAWEGISEKMQFHAFHSPIIVSIPVSKKRLRYRGYNHVSLIAQGFASENPSECEIVNNVLEKYRETKRQAEIKVRKDRLANLKNSFRVVDPLYVKDRNIILLDDVTTTGATFEEATRALKKAGARKVLRIALAH